MDRTASSQCDDDARTSERSGNASLTVTCRLRAVEGSPVAAGSFESKRTRPLNVVTPLLVSKFFTVFVVSFVVTPGVLIPVGSSSSIMSSLTSPTSIGTSCVSPCDPAVAVHDEAIEACGAMVVYGSLFVASRVPASTSAPPSSTGNFQMYCVMPEFSNTCAE